VSVSKREEEYIELMYRLYSDKGVIRIKDIAARLNVKPPSVVEYLDKLARKGYIRYEKGEVIRLTEEGMRIGREVYERHKALRDFLKILLGLPEEIADEDACYIEHGVHQETIERIKLFVEFVKSNPGSLPDWFKYLRERLKASE